MAEMHILTHHRTAVALKAVPRPDSACDTCTVRSLTICAGLNDNDQSRMGDLASSICLPPHQQLFSEGDDAGSVYNITCGSIAVSKSMSDGRRQITGFLGPGDFLGLNTRDTYTVSAETLTETRVCKFPQAAFRRLMNEMPVLEHRLLALRESELALAQDQILLLGRKTAMERIASFLLLQADRMRQRGLPSNPVLLPMTRAEVGDYLGLTIETVSRCFTRLRKTGVIALQGADRVQIRDTEQLRALSEPA